LLAFILANDLAEYCARALRDYAIITDMEPKLPSPENAPEMRPVNYEQQTERSPAETGFDQGQEKVEQRAEAPPQAVAYAAPVLPPPVVAPLPPQTTTDSSVAGNADDDLPIVANDDDLIEKEWVDKAKKIIIQTKDDPYRREQEVVKLQADYLQKRYGRELGASQ